MGQECSAALGAVAAIGGCAPSVSPRQQPWCAADPAAAACRSVSSASTVSSGQRLQRVANLDWAPNTSAATANVSACKPLAPANARRQRLRICSNCQSPPMANRQQLHANRRCNSV